MREVIFILFLFYHNLYIIPGFYTVLILLVSIITVLEASRLRLTRKFPYRSQTICVITVVVS